MKFKLWPVGIESYNINTGKKIENSSRVKVGIIHCPRCYVVLQYQHLLSEKEYQGVFCFKCGRDLRKPFTKWDKIRLWLRWMGDRRLLVRWPIGYLK